ncbi:MAG: SURF1 family protein [Lysobacterales bacterium]
MKQGRHLGRALLGYAVLTLLSSGGLASLGIWQLQRAEQKQQLLDAIDRAGSEKAVDLGDALANGVDLHFRAVTARGRYLPDRQILLDNQIRNGEPGVQVFVPLQLDGGGQMLLVDRGWLPWRDRAGPLPIATVSTESVAVDGLLLSAPAAGLVLGAEVRQQWPLLVTRIDLADLERRLQQPLLDLVLEDRQTPRAQTLRSGMLPPERHRGYALQWFGLSLTVIIIFGVLTIRSWRARSITPS